MVYIAVRVSIKPASSSVPLVKQIGIVYDENGSPRSSGKVENLSDPTLTLKSEEKQYTVPEEEKEVKIIVVFINQENEKLENFKSFF